MICWDDEEATKVQRDIVSFVSSPNFNSGVTTNWILCVWGVQ